MKAEEYEESTRVLATMIRQRRNHLAEGGCQELACPGRAARLALHAGAEVDSAWPLRLVVAAVCLLADFQWRMDDLERALEIQRGMTADAAANAMSLDADLVDAHGQIAGLEERVSGLLAELTAREESADVIGPVLPVSDK